jgi:PAP2 superfamily
MLKILKIILFIFIIVSCKKETEPIIIPPNADVAILWGKMTLKFMNKYPGNSPVYASRALGYFGLTMYESVVNGSNKYKSIANQLNNLGPLPIPEKNKKYNWVLALNAGQSFLVKNIYDNADKSRIESIDSLENAIEIEYSIGFDKETIERSKKYGKLIGEKIFEWSKTDGGFQGYKRNFDPTYVFPSGDGKWIPPVAGQVTIPLPLQPFWGGNRTFLKANQNILVPKLINYSEDKNSDYYKYFNEVFEKSQTLTQSEKEIAAWWADDPTETFSPPGHSYSIAGIIIQTDNSDLFKAAETYSKVGMAVADSFINCWKAKFTYHCERPSKYIQKNIYENFSSYWPEPPFPAFYSGHSVQSAASAKVLESIYGTNFSFIDNSHQGRTRDKFRNLDYTSRSFNTIWESAIEAADSRFYGGIHTKLDNKIGTEEGIKIAKNITSLNFFK